MIKILYKPKIKWLKLLIPLLITLPPSGILLTKTLFKQDIPSSYRYQFTEKIPGTTDTTKLIINEITFYKERNQVQPDSGLNHAALAKAYLKLARATGQNSWYLLAETTAQRSLQLLPFDNNSAIIVLARTAQAQHNFTEALRLSEQVLKSQPSNEDALSIIATSNLAMGKLDTARKAAYLLVQRIPSQASLTLQALVQTAQGQNSTAIDTFKSALAVEEAGENGTSAWTRVALGRVYYKQGELELAGGLYREALRILPKYPLAILHLAELETRRGNYGAAENYYNQIRVYSPGASTTFDHAVLHGKAKIKQLQSDEKSADVLFTEAETLLRQENSQEKSSINGSFGHRRELARLLLERGQPKDVTEALLLMQTEVKIRRDAQTLDTLAWALLRNRKNKEAQKTIQEALQLGTRDAEILYRAATIEKALLNNAQAMEYEQQIKAIDPSFDTQAKRISGIDYLGF
ncbi:Tetratricopeptide TPR_2 repeat protein [Rivularia sp. IAM M-261]|nr:Tetratricopeptide TPR_2 repeat protein [Rivularia sp. IAM M-261]